MSLSLITLTGVGSAFTSVGTTVPVVTTSSSRCADFSSAKSAVASWSALTVTDAVRRRVPDVPRPHRVRPRRHVRDPIAPVVARRGAPRRALDRHRRPRERGLGLGVGHSADDRPRRRRYTAGRLTSATWLDDVISTSTPASSRISVSAAATVICSARRCTRASVDSTSRL